MKFPDWIKASAILYDAKPSPALSRRLDFVPSNIGYPMLLKKQTFITPLLPNGPTPLRSISVLLFPLHLLAVLTRHCFNKQEKAKPFVSFVSSNASLFVMGVAQMSESNSIYRERLDWNSGICVADFLLLSGLLVQGYYRIVMKKEIY